MTKFMPFYLDTKNFVTNQKCFIITGKYLAYLTAFFNSNIFKVCYREDFPELKGGTRELSKVFFKEIKIKPISYDIETFFDRLIMMYQKNGSDLTLETKINKKLYELYNLTDEEKTYITAYS